MKRGRGRPKKTQAWFTFYCPKCNAKYGALMACAEFSCYNTPNCKGAIAVKKGTNHGKAY